MNVLKSCIAALAAALAAGDAFAVAASQAWVENFVSNYVANSAAEIRANTTTASSNGFTVVTANAGTENEVRLVMQDATDAALRATNCTAAAVSASVTNGTLFVWNGAGEYVSPAGSIEATATNLVWRGVGSVPSGGLERFVGWFDAKGVRIQPDASFAITNAIQEASR